MADCHKARKQVGQAPSSKPSAPLFAHSKFRLEAYTLSYLNRLVAPEPAGRNVSVHVGICTLTHCKQLKTNMTPISLHMT